jgi:hypothetical protein
MNFTTYDRDNDPWGSNCAVFSKGAWWYKTCLQSNLNGLYLKAGEISGEGTFWLYWKIDRRSINKTEMKIRPAGF